MDRAKERQKRRGRIRQRVRRKLTGTPERPRLAVFKSLHHIYAQAIDDHNGVTLAAASSLDAEIRDAKSGANVGAAKAVGELLGKRLKERGIETAVFDRGGYLYHGRVKALADAVREQGLRF
jgi:large subunit ribosomal protein L18